VRRPTTLDPVRPRPVAEKSSAEKSSAEKLRLAGNRPAGKRRLAQKLGLVVLALAGLCVIGAWAIMVRVCSDAKPVPPRNYRTLPFFDGLPPVLDIAHRGASKLAPEHTLEAYRLALAQGAHVLELDLRLLRDRELVIAHDRTLRRTHGVEVAFSELAWADLERIAGAHLPIRLSQALRQFPSVRFNLELKDETPDAAHALAASLAEAGAEGRVLVASGHEAVLAEFRRASGGRVATSASTAEALGYYFCYLMQRPCATPYSALQLPTLGWLGITRAEFIAAAHERGLAVHFWTVDDPERMRALLAAGADGIMTNRPDVLAPLLAELRPAP
jgi:glycerophosphoryl diester phosphodiesterase